MLKIKLYPGDVVGDLIVTESSPTNTLGGWQSAQLLKGNSLYSPSGAFRFTFQDDGNIVLQNVIDATLNRKWMLGEELDPRANPPDIEWNAIGATGTNDQSTIEVDMQLDGNLVVYNGAGPIWNSTTEGYLEAFLRMQDDGNLVIYCQGGAIWNSGTTARTGQGGPGPNF